jgi:hypothetical protein
MKNRAAKKQITYKEEEEEENDSPQTITYYQKSKTNGKKWNSANTRSSQPQPKRITKKKAQKKIKMVKTYEKINEFDVFPLEKIKDDLFKDIIIVKKTKKTTLLLKECINLSQKRNIKYLKFMDLKSKKISTFGFNSNLLNDIKRIKKDQEEQKKTILDNKRRKRISKILNIYPNIPKDLMKKAMNFVPKQKNLNLKKFAEEAVYFAVFRLIYRGPAKIAEIKENLSKEYLHFSFFHQHEHDKQTKLYEKRLNEELEKQHKMETIFVNKYINENLCVSDSNTVVNEDLVHEYFEHINEENENENDKESEEESTEESEEGSFQDIEEESEVESDEENNE